MSDKKLDAKRSGFLSIFRRKGCAATSTNVPSNGKQERSRTPPPRRAYKPRHAERDMVLSMPVEQRPDLVAKANEARLQGVCSDIGFSTSALPSSVSSHSRAGSQNWSSRHMPTHPNLHLKLQEAPGTANSIHDSVLQGTDVYRMSSIPASLRDQYTNSSDAELSSRVLQAYRPGPRSYHSVAAVPQPDSTSIEAMNQAYAELGISGADFEPEQVLQRPYIDTGAAYASHRLMATHATARQQTSYFGHNDALPNLRGDKGKNKQGARPFSTAGHSVRGGASEKEYLDDRESYVVRTTASPTSSSSAAPSLPGNSPKHSAYDPESSSSSFAESFENINDLSSRADSERNPSTSTFMTSYTESSKAITSTEQSYQLDTAAPREDVGLKSPIPADESRHGREEHEHSEVESDPNDETSDSRTRPSGDSRHDATEKIRQQSGGP